MLLHHRPAVIFQGDLFEYEPTFVRIKNLLLDFFVENITIPHINIKEGLNRLTTITAADDKNIFIRHYEITSKTDQILNAETDLVKIILKITLIKLMMNS